MSRSRKKAIYKDKGHRKKDFWKVHRRINKNNLKGILSTNYTVKYTYGGYDEWDLLDVEYLYKNDPFKLEYYSWELRECYDIYLKNLVIGDGGLLNEYYIPAKTLINDYDYSDYRIDYEFDRQRGYYRDYSGNKGSETWKEDRNSYAKKLRRK